jgi:hypothetical protein
MGINKCYVLILDKVKEQYKSLGHEQFKNLYKKRDVLIGPDDSIKFIKQKLSE